MSLISVSNLSFAYEGSYDEIFSNVSFQIDTAWKLGFCGRNGRGKTTFLKLLMGEYEYRGKIDAPVDFEYFPFPLENRREQTYNILFSIAPDAAQWQMEKELSLLAVDLSVLTRPFSELSHGEQTKTLLAGLFLRQNRFLLIDEPTNHLDAGGRETVARYLNGKDGFILVSHDRAFLDGCTDHTLSINKNGIEVIGGSFSAWWAQKARQDSFERAENERLQKDIRRLNESAGRTGRWSDALEKTKIGTRNAGLKPDRGYIGHKSAKMMKRSKAIEGRKQAAIEEKSKLLKNIEASDPLKMHPMAHHASRLILLEKAAVSYNGREIFSDLSFALEQGDRLAVLGGNGSGKSSLLKLICGRDIPHTGHLHVAGRLVISYLPQDASFLAGDLRRYAKGQGIDETLLKATLRKLDFSREQFEKDMSAYSAGQKKKVLLAAGLCRHAHLFVWDEPLNYIDILSRMQIEELILAYKPTMLFVEHDRAFCSRVATKSVTLG